MRFIMPLFVALATTLAASAGAYAQTASGAPLTVNSSIGELLDNEAARAILEREVPVIAKSPQIAAGRDFSLKTIAQYAPTVLTDEKLAAIDTALAQDPAARSDGKIRAKAAPNADPAAAFDLQTVRLWSGDAPGALGDRPQDIPTLTVIPTNETVSFGSAVIVAPGGGYQGLATGMEGRQVADWFAAHGVTAFVLTYRLTPFGYKHPTQLLDAKRAVRWVRTHAAEYGIDPNRIGMIGFSAGGHLTAMAETLFDAGDPAATDPVERVSSRPDFAVLSYAAIDLPSNRWDSLGFLKGKPNAKLMKEVSPAQNVRPDTPPTFIWQTTADELVPPRNATLMYDALVAHKVPAELHIFAKGRHGLGLGMTDAALSAWPALLRTWLEEQGIIGLKRAQ